MALPPTEIHDTSLTDISATLSALFDTGLTRPLKWRRRQLSAISAMLIDHEQDFIQALFLDLGKPANESWSSEIGYVRSDIRHTLKQLKKWCRPKKVSTPLMAQPARSYRIAEPLGKVLIIGAWNYPLQLVLCPCVAALAAGNCVALKPSEQAPHTSALLTRLLPQYIDCGALAVIEGGKEITSGLLEHRWDHIFYTGGAQVARIVMQAAARHLTPVTLELGGKSPCIVDSRADVKVAARRIVWGKWMNAGQTCIAPDYILAERQYIPELIIHLKREISTQYGSDPLSNSDYGKIINAAHFQRLTNYLEQGEVLVGGEYDPSELKIAPTIIASEDPDAAIMQEEIFGPVLPVVPLEKIEDAISYINAKPKPLALYLFSNDTGLESQVIRQTSAGSVCINDVMMFMTNPALPFGGVGESGMGSYHGEAGFNTFSHTKSVMRRSVLFDIPVRYPPFARWKLAIIKKLL